VSNWSNRFASIALPALLTACGSTPSAQPAARETPVSTVAGTAPSKAQLTAAQPPTAAATPIPERAAQQYAQAMQLMKAGRTTDAELEFKQLSLSYPEVAGPQINLGLLYLKESQLADAEAAFKAALERSPGNAIAGNELGIVERKLGKFPEAEAAYKGAIAAEPNYASAHLNLGVLYDLYLAEPQKALEQFELYLSIAGENKQVAGWVAELRKRVGAAAPAANKESS
jgi:tetratricopeptide (TPR) repeat protein